MSNLNGFDPKNFDNSTTPSEDASAQNPLGQAQAQGINIILNNTNTNTNVNENINTGLNAVSVGSTRKIGKIPYAVGVAFGILGVNRFMRGQTGLGIGYLFTGGLFVIGWAIDIFEVATKWGSTPGDYFQFNHDGSWA